MIILDRIPNLNQSQQSYMTNLKKLANQKIKRSESITGKSSFSKNLSKPQLYWNIIKFRFSRLTSSAALKRRSVQPPSRFNSSNFKESKSVLTSNLTWQTLERKSLQKMLNHFSKPISQFQPSRFPMKSRPKLKRKHQTKWYQHCRLYVVHKQ